MNKIVLTTALLLNAAISTWAAADTRREQATQIVIRMQRADYEGDRPTLKKCYDELTPFLDDKDLASRIRYWRGFARWRDGINAGNESVDATEMEKLFQEGADEFKAAFAIDPSFVDAKFGIISCLGHCVYFHRTEKERAQEMVKPIFALVSEAKAAAPDNPRLIWVMGPILFYTPPEKGGGIDKVIENNQRGVSICSQLTPPADKLEPSWGKPELLMSLAYEYLTKSPADLDQAERHARAALEIVPYWHYVRDILMPRIVEARAKGKQASPTS